MDTKNSMVCKKCGAQTAGDITYCPHCGELLPHKSASILVDRGLLGVWEEAAKELLYTMKYTKNSYAPGFERQYKFVPNIMRVFWTDFFVEVGIAKHKAEKYDRIIKWSKLVGIVSILLIIAVFFVVTILLKE